MKLIFLDIDGVLNRNGDRRTFHPECVDHFNSILAVTEAHVVISSSWRNLMIPQDGDPADMTISGFTTMLRTHGIVGLRIVGHVGPDFGTRGMQCRHWLRQNREYIKYDRYVAIDDCDHGFTAESFPLILTDPSRGIDADVSRDVILILNRNS